MMAKTNWFTKKKEDPMESPSKKRKPNPEASQEEGGVNTQTGSESNIVQDKATLEGGCVNTQTGSVSNIIQEASKGGGGVNAQTGSESNIISEASMGGGGVDAQTGSRSNIVKDPGAKRNIIKGQGAKKQKSVQEIETLAVLFVDQTKGGALQKAIQAAEDNIALMVGYRVRVVETSGTQLCRLFPYTNP